jgi:hypothetical protein
MFQARNWIRGVVVIAAGVLAGWLTTFFSLSPGRIVKDQVAFVVSQDPASRDQGAFYIPDAGGATTSRPACETPLARVSFARSLCWTKSSTQTKSAAPTVIGGTYRQVSIAIFQIASSLGGRCTGVRRRLLRTFVQWLTSRTKSRQEEQCAICGTKDRASRARALPGERQKVGLHQVSPMVIRLVSVETGKNLGGQAAISAGTE